jgi:Putative adhesin
MFTILRNLLVLCALAVTASAASEEIVKRQLDAAPGGKLVVDVDFGSVDVTAGSDDKVNLEAHRMVDFGNEAKEKEFLADAPITFTKEGNVITVRSRGKKPNDLWNLIGHCKTDATYVVRVPKKFESALRTDGGTVSASDLSGNLSAHTSGGRMAFARLEGTLDGDTSGGAIEVDDCRGPIGIETSGGHIKVTGGQGNLKAHTSGGRIEVHNFSGDTEIRTSGGSLDLEKVSGKIVGKTSGGGIRAWLPELVGDVKLETSAGSIDLAVPASAAFTIDANTSVGGVKSLLPFQALEADREHLRGTLNGGGKSVRLQTSAGSITIKATSEEIAHR